MALLLADLSLLYGVRGDVMSRRAESPGVIVWLTSCGLMMVGCVVVSGGGLGTCAGAGRAGGDVDGDLGV